MTPFKLTDDGIEVRIRATPKASRNVIGDVVADEQGNGVLKVAVTAVPEKGSANVAVIGLLAKTWRLRKSDMVILRGQTDRNKTVLIAGADKTMLADLTARINDESKGNDT